MRSCLYNNIPTPSFPFLRWILLCLVAIGILFTTERISPAFAATAITDMEYFIDVDSGPGNGITIPIPPDSGPIIQLQIPGISTDFLSKGSYLLFVRAKDNDGVWGPARQIRFEMPYAGIALDPVHINQAEYFLDSDPGEGLGTAIPPPAGESYDSLRESVALTDIDTLNLTIRHHTLYVRMRSSDGTWGKARPQKNDLLFAAPFNVEVTGTKTVEVMEYYFDADPGEGQGIPLTPPSSVGDRFAFSLKGISIDHLSTGRHMLHVRAKDSDGFWGPAYQKWFEIIDTDLTINGIEYFIDTDPGAGLGIPLPPDDGSYDEGAENASGLIETIHLTEEVHHIFARAKDSDGKWSATRDVTVTIGPPPDIVITSINPSSGRIGTSVEISGSNFGNTQETSTVTFNGKTAAISSWSNAAIEAVVPEGATSGPVIVTVNGAASNTDHMFTVIIPPNITNMAPSMGIIGTEVRITGAHFGSNGDAGTVTFNGVAATVISWSDTVIEAIVPEGASDGPVVVTVNGISSNSDLIFTVLNSTSLSGHAYADRNDNGRFDEGEGIIEASVALEPIQSCIGVMNTFSAITDPSGNYSISNIPQCTYSINATWQGRSNTATYSSPSSVFNAEGDAPIQLDIMINKSIQIETILVDFTNNRFNPSPSTPLGSEWTTRFKEVRDYHRHNSKGLIDLNFSSYHYIQMNQKDTDFNTEPNEEIPEKFVKTILCQAFEENMIPADQKEDTLYLIAYSGDNFRAFAVPVNNYACPTGAISAYSALVGTWDGKFGFLGVCIDSITLL